MLSQKWGSQRTPAGVGVGAPPASPRPRPLATAPPPPRPAPTLSSRPRPRPRSCVTAPAPAPAPPPRRGLPGGVNRPTLQVATPAAAEGRRQRSPRAGAGEGGRGRSRGPRSAACARDVTIAAGPGVPGSAWGGGLRGCERGGQGLPSHGLPPAPPPPRRPPRRPPPPGLACARRLRGGGRWEWLHPLRLPCRARPFT